MVMGGVDNTGHGVVIRLNDLTVEYHDRRAVDHLTLDIPAGILDEPTKDWTPLPQQRCSIHPALSLRSNTTQHCDRRNA